MPACVRYSVSVSQSGLPAITAGSIMTRYAAGKMNRCLNFIFFATSSTKNIGITNTAWSLNANEAVMLTIAPTGLSLSAR